MASEPGDLERLRAAAIAGDVRTVGDIIHSHHSFPPPLKTIEQALDEFLDQVGRVPESEGKAKVLSALAELISRWLDDTSWWQRYHQLETEDAKNEWAGLAGKWYEVFSEELQSGRTDSLPRLAKSFEMWFKLPSDEEAYGLWRSAFVALSSKSPPSPVHLEAILGILSPGLRESRGGNAYCVKCKKHVRLRMPSGVTPGNKRPPVQGSCPYCGTKVFRIGRSPGESAKPPSHEHFEKMAPPPGRDIQTADLEAAFPPTTEQKKQAKSNGGDHSQKDTAQERYVNLWFTRQEADQPRVPRERTLIKGQTVYLRVQIAPYDRMTILRDAKPFPKQEEIWAAHPELKEKEIPLEVTLFSNDFEISENHRTKALTLKLGESTAILYFPVKATRMGRAQLRLCVFYQNHMLQSLIVRASVAATETASDEPQQASIEMTFSPAFRNVDEMPRRTAWIGINDNTDGTHTIMVKGHDQKSLTRRLESNIETALTEARDKLLEVSFRKGTHDYRFDRDNVPLDASRFRKDMVELAKTGRKLFSAVFGDAARPFEESFDKSQAAIKAMREILHTDQTDSQGLTIQIVRFHFDSMWPWALMYDLPLETDASQVCMDFSKDGATIRPYAACVKTCTHRDTTSHKHDSAIVCPYGFWGFKGIVEQPVTHGVTSMLPQVIKVGGDEPLFEMPAIRKVDDKHVETMKKASFRVLESRCDVKKSFEEHEPHIVYFFCHCDRTGKDVDIKVGDDHSPERLEPGDFYNWTEEWQNESRNPLVFINGCHTVDLLPGDLSPLMLPFVNAQASGIIGTEITVHSYLATEFARAFFERFIGRGPGTGQKVGRIMRDLRLELLMKHNPLGLVYTAYCSADLHLE